MTREQAIKAAASFLDTFYFYDQEGRGKCVSEINAAEDDDSLTNVLNKYLCEVEDFIHELKVGLISKK